jgi:hypothetical protein
VFGEATLHAAFLLDNGVPIARRNTLGLVKLRCICIQLLLLYCRPNMTHVTLVEAQIMNRI